MWSTVMVPTIQYWPMITNDVRGHSAIFALKEHSNTMRELLTSYRIYKKTMRVFFLYFISFRMHLALYLKQRNEYKVIFFSHAQDSYTELHHQPPELLGEANFVKAKVCANVEIKWRRPLRKRKH